MAIIKKTVNRYECDGCGKAQYGEITDDVNGLVGTVAEHTDSGGMVAEWFACKRRCIAAAIDNALTMEYGR